jgi:hypothetical protein
LNPVSLNGSNIIGKLHFDDHALSCRLIPDEGQDFTNGVIQVQPSLGISALLVRPRFRAMISPAQVPLLNDGTSDLCGVDASVKLIFGVRPEAHV